MFESVRQSYWLRHLCAEGSEVVNHVEFLHHLDHHRALPPRNDETMASRQFLLIGKSCPVTLAEHCMCLPSHSLQSVQYRLSVWIDARLPPLHVPASTHDEVRASHLRKAVIAFKCASDAGGGISLVRPRGSLVGVMCFEGRQPTEIFRTSLHVIPGPHFLSVAMCSAKSPCIIARSFITSSEEQKWRVDEDRVVIKPSNPAANESGSRCSRPNVLQLSPEGPKLRWSRPSLSRLR